MSTRTIGPANAADGTAIAVHATCVCAGSTAALIIGPSGAGKSALALHLLALGCRLIADDQTHVARRGDALVVSAPERISGRIEARGVGILNVPSARRAILQLVVDMGQSETDRLPPRRSCSVLGVRLPLLHKVESAHFPAAVRLCMRGGKCD